MSEPRILGLSSEHWAIMEKTGREGMLLDTHIDKFIDILEHYDTPYRMQSTLLVQIPRTIRRAPRDQPCLQILFRGPIDSGHWICVWYDTEVLHVYDSANARILHQDHKIFLRRLLPHDNIPVVFEKVQQQLNDYDCGVFSIAFAICIVSGINPCSVQYDIARMRSHLIEMFRSNCLRNFPIIHENSLRHDGVSPSFTNIGHRGQCDQRLIATVEEGSRALESAKKKCTDLKRVITKQTVTKEPNSHIHKATAVELGQEAEYVLGKHRAQETAGEMSKRLESVEIYVRTQAESIENADDIRAAMARKRAADRMKNTRANESEEQRSDRLKVAATYKKMRRESLSKADETHAVMTRREVADRMHQTRSKECKEQRINRLQAAATYKKAKRAFPKIDESNKRKYSGKEVSSRTKKNKNRV